MTWRERLRFASRVARDEPDGARFSGGLALGPIAPWTVGGIYHGLSAPLIAPRISKEEALQVPAVLRGRNLIAGTIASLPLYTYDKGRNKVRTPLLDQIDPNVPNTVTIAQTVEDLLFEGRSLWRVKAFGWDGFPVEAEHINVVAWSTSPPPGFPLNSLPSGMFPNGVLWVMGEPVDGSQVIRFDSPNPPLLISAARAIRRALKLEQAADRYADEPQALGWFTPAEGADPAEDEDIQTILDDWQRARTSRATGYVPAALKYNPNQWSPADLQLAELQQKATLALANAMGLDPEDLGVSTTSRTYQNAIDRRVDRINECYAPYLKTVEDRLSMRDVTPRGRYVCFDLDEFLQADPKTRWETYAIAAGIGGMTNDEIREEEERPALPPAEVPVIAPPNVTPERIRQEADNVTPLRSASVNFAADVIGFDLDSPSAQFRVDSGQRIISGIAVPYGPVARSGGRKWRFTQGSLRYADVTRVKLLRDHDHSQAVGKAISLDDTAQGLYARFRVGRGAEGDKVLALAEDGILDGLSVGVDFEDEGSFEPDPADGSINVVRRAALREITLTAMPAFDGSRVDSVAATSTETDLAMSTATTEPQAPAVPAAAPDFAAFTAGLTDAIGTAVADAFTKLPIPQGREAVNPTRAVVREPLTYTLDGRGASFIQDAWEAQKGRYGSKDTDDALARLRKYEQQTVELSEASYATFANTGNTTDQAQIIPPGYRPDLYVGQIPQGRPLFEAMSRGQIANANPFKVPVWVSGSGLSGTNSEGTGPSTGTITNHTYITVTPTAQSGEFEIARELVDSANPAIDQIALAAMREEYSQDTEAVIATALAAATDDNTAGRSTEGCYVYAVSGDGVDLSGQVRTVEGQFPFHRFNVAPNRVLLSSEGFGGLVGAVDLNGRALFPFVSPLNALGSVGQSAQTLSVDGLAGTPAWGLNTTYDDVVLFNSVDAWAWESGLLSFRFEEKSGPEKIVLNIWGYFAFQILRYAGIHAIAYTAA